MLAAVFAGAPAAAQKAPDAGSILREQRQSVPDLTPPPAFAAPLSPPPSTPSRKAGETVHVTDIQINAKLFPEATLKDLVRDAIGKEASLGDLQALTARIGAFYREHGILARAYLPSQTLENGVVTINVIEATLGQVRIDPSSKIRLRDGTAQDFILNEQPAGETFHLDAVEDGVGNLMTLPGMNVLATVAPGANPGQSDLVLKLDEGPLVSGNTLIDNGASRAVGGWRWVGAASLNDALGFGDQFAVTLSKSEGSRLALLRGEMPIDYSGWRAGFEVAALDFDTLRRFNASQPRGAALSGGAYVSHPLWHGEDSTAEGRFSYYSKKLLTNVSGSPEDRTTIDEAVATITGLAQDFGDGIVQFNVTLVRGRIDLSDSPDTLTHDATTARSQGSFGRADGTLSRTQPLSREWSALLRLSGQKAYKNLDSSEQFSLGGPDQLRAYPVGEAAGDEGWQASGELRNQISEDVQLSMFWDGGQIIQHARPWAGWQGSGGAHNLYFLQGVGAGAGWRMLPWLSLDFAGAHQLGPNPGADSHGRYADGYGDRWRGWVRLGASF